jgi:nucleotide-binding universal stress UspA family protein
MAPSIVVPLDGSDLAEMALLPAIALAGALAGDLLLLRATWHQPPVDEERYLDEVAERTGFDRTRVEVVHGFASEAIASTLLGLDDPIVCLATHGRGGFGGHLLGSVAQEVVRRASAPVVVVGPGFIEGSTVAIGGSLVHCRAEGPSTPGLDAMVTRWAAALGLAVRTRPCPEHDDRRTGATREGTGQDQLLRIDVRADDVALVAVGSGASTTGAGRPFRLGLGSIAERVVQSSRVPVMIMRT